MQAPTREEAEKVASDCNVKVAYWDGAGPPPPERMYQPVDATAAQSECYFTRIRQLLAKPKSDNME